MSIPKGKVKNVEYVKAIDKKTMEIKVGNRIYHISSMMVDYDDCELDIKRIYNK